MAGTLSAISPAAAITIAGINGYITVDNPDFQCSCGKRVSVHPVSMDCFPAAPSRADIWYDNQLLALIAAAQHAGTLAIQAHSTVLQQLDSFNGLDRKVSNAIAFYKHQLHGVQAAIQSRQAAHLVPTAQSIFLQCCT